MMSVVQQSFGYRANTLSREVVSEGVTCTQVKMDKETYPTIGGTTQNNTEGVENSEKET